MQTSILAVVSGWGFVGPIILLARYGWMLGLAALAGAFFLRKTRRPAAGVLLVLLLSGGLVLTALSLGLQAGFARKLSGTPAPALETRRAVKPE